MWERRLAHVIGMFMSSTTIFGVFFSMLQTSLVPTSMRGECGYMVFIPTLGKSHVAEKTACGLKGGV